MIKNLLFIFVILMSLKTEAQILGSLQSIYPDNAQQGQTLTTTITEQQGSYLLGSPPCDNFGIYFQMGNDIIYSNYYNWIGMDMVDVNFTIPAAATPGFYDVYLASTHYDWWSGMCTTLGYWVLTGGFQVTLANDIQANHADGLKASLSPNPVSDKSILRFSNKDNKQFELTVLDAFGRNVMHAATVSDKFIINRNDLPAGIYFYRLEGRDDKSSLTGKFVVIQ